MCVVDKIVKKIMYGLVGCGLLTAVAHAQTIPPQIDSSRIEERVPQALRDSPGLPAIDIPLIDGLPKDELPTDDSEDVRFAVKKIVLVDNTVFDDETLQKEIENAIGEDISLQDLQDAAQKITYLYRKRGYAFSKAFIPPQTLEDDTVIIQIVEGYVGGVEYRGIPVSKDSPIYRYAKRLSEYRPVKKNDLERYVLLINDLAGIEAKVVAAPLENTPGAIKLIFLIDKTTHSAGVSLNNRGSDALGPAQAVVHYQANDLSGRGDQTRLVHLRTPTNNELSYLSLSQTWPIGSEGGKLSYQLRQSASEPGESASAFDIDSVSNSYSIDYYYPWLRTRQENLSTRLTFDSRNSSTESFDSEIIDDHIRYLRAELDYRNIHDGGITNVKSRFSYGLDIFDATGDNNIQASRLGGSSTADKLQAEIIRQQVIDADWSLTLKAAGQWAFDPLLSAELFGLGGTDYGRGFDFSTITGDSGYAASAQLTYRVPSIPADIDMIDRMALFGFIDGGQVFDETNVAGSDWEGLSSAGIGMDIGAFEHVYGRLEVTRPIQIQGNVDHDIEAFGTIGFRVNF